MARGITESEVHAAADDIVRTGDRPTVERIRAHLGTGSPNTVIKWLETWWKGVGKRLDTHGRGLAIPDAPEGVIGLAGQWWHLAIEHARSAADDALAVERARLDREVEALKGDRAIFAAEALALRELVSSTSHKADLAAVQVAELQRLALRLEEQLKEVGQQRDVALALAASGESTRQTLEARIQLLQDAAQAERESLSQHVRAVEDRALGEVDRARQQAKESQARLLATSRESAAAEQSLRQLIDQANVKAIEASRDAAAQRARADAFEGQLSKLGELSAALEAAFSRTDARPKARKTRREATIAADSQTGPEPTPSPPASRRRRAKGKD